MEVGLEPQLAVQRLEKDANGSFSRVCPRQFLTKQFGFLVIDKGGELRKTCLQVAGVPKIFPNSEELTLSTEQQAQKPVGIREVQDATELGSWHGVE